MRRAARIDGNQKEIVDTYRRCGCSVHVTSAVGKGFPDIVVGKYGLNDLVEIKDGSKPPSEQKLTEDEARFFSRWQGSVKLVTTTQDVFDHVHELNEKAQRLTEYKIKKAFEGES